MFGLLWSETKEEKKEVGKEEPKGELEPSVNTTGFMTIDARRKKDNDTFMAHGMKFGIIRDSNELILSCDYDSITFNLSEMNIRYYNKVVTDFGIELRENDKRILEKIGLKKNDCSKALVVIMMERWLMIQGDSSGFKAFSLKFGPLHYEKGEMTEMSMATMKIKRMNHLGKTKEILSMSRIELMSVMGSDVPLTTNEKIKVERHDHELTRAKFIEEFASKRNEKMERELEEYSRDTNYNFTSNSTVVVLFFLLMFCNSVKGFVKICGNVTINGVTEWNGECPGEHFEYDTFYHGSKKIDNLWLKQVEVESSNKTEYKCTSKGKFSTHCQTKCIMNGGKCTGDKNYCSENSCSKKHSCYCKKICVDEELTGLEEGRSVSIKRVKKMWYHDHVDLKFKLSKRSVEQLEVYMEIDSNEVDVTVSREGNYTMIFRKGDYVVKKEIEKFHKFVIPLNVLTHSGVCTVRIYEGDKLVSMKEGHMVGYFPCMMPQCVACWEILSVHHCMNMKQRIGAYTLILYQLTGVMSLVSMIFVICVSVKTCLRAPYVLVLNIKDGVKESKLIKWLKKMSTERNLGESKKHDDMVHQKEVNMKSNGMSRTSVVGLVILSMVTGGLSCGDQFSISAESTNCVRDGQEEVCSFSISTLALASAPGTKSCFSIMDESDEELVKFEVDYQTKFRVLTNRDLYYSSNWRGESESIAACFGTSMCNHEMACNDEHVFDLDKTTPVNTFADYHQMWPGHTDCFRTAGCVTSGCFSCVNQCVYSTYSIIPTGAPFKVSAIEGSRILTIFTISFGEGDSKVDYIFNNFDGKRVHDFGNFSISTEFQGSFEGPSFDFNDRKIIHYSDGSGGISEASPRNQPSKSTVGDIQASSVQELNEGNFIFDFEMASKSEVGQTAIYTFAGSGVDLSNVNAFPTTSSGFVWQYNEESVFAFDETATTVSYTIQTEGAASIRRLIKSVCPEMVIEVADGCFSCDMGFVLTVRAKSICEEGTAILRTSSVDVTVQTQTLSLMNEEKVFEVLMTSNKASPSFELCLEAGGRKSCDSASITLKEDIVVRNETSSTNNTIHESLGFSILESLGNDFNWFYEIFIWLGMIGALALVIFLMVKLIPCLYKTNMRAAGYSKVKDK